jgi:hypothetical protein
VWYNKGVKRIGISIGKKTHPHLICQQINLSSSMSVENPLECCEIVVVVFIDLETFLTQSVTNNLTQLLTQ